MKHNKSHSLLNDVDIRYYLGGQLSSEIGSRITREGIPIVAILVVAASASELGVLAALATLPGLLMGNIAGHWVDHHHRRPVIIAANILRAAMLLTIPLLFWIHHLNFLALTVVTLVASAAGVFLNIARHAYLPSLVTRARLEEANDLLGTAEAIGETTGPALMGLLIEWVGAPVSIAFDAVANILSAIAVVRIRGLESHPQSGNSYTALSATSVKKSWARVLSHPVLRPLAMNAGMSAFFGGFFSTLYELYVLKTLHLSPLLLGLLITLGGAGSLVASRLMRILRRRFGIARLITYGYLTFALLNLAVPAARGAHWMSFGLLLIAQFGGDLFGSVFEISATTVEQQVTPDHWLGRVHGTFRAVTGGLEVMGALVAGPLTLLITMRTEFWVADGGLLLAGIFLFTDRLTKLSASRYSTRWDFDT